MKGNVKLVVAYKISTFLFFFMLTKVCYNLLKAVASQIPALSVLLTFVQKLSD